MNNGAEVPAEGELEGIVPAEELIGCELIGCDRVIEGGMEGDLFNVVFGGALLTDHERRDMKREWKYSVRGQRKVSWEGWSYQL